jgi:hypothetical protein
VPSVERPGRRARLVVGCRRRNSCTVSYRVPSVERPGRRARLVVGCRRRNSCTVSYRVPSVERPGRRARLVVGCRRRNSCTVSYRVPSVERPGRRARLVVGCRRRNSCTVSYRVPSVERPGRRARLVVGCRRRNSCTVSYRVPSVERPGRRARLVVGCRRRNSCTVSYRVPSVERPGRRARLVVGCRRRNSCTVTVRTLPRSSVEPPLDRGGTSRQQPDIGLCRDARSNRHSTGEAPVASRRTSDFAETLGRTAIRPGRHQSPVAGHRTLPRSSVEPPLDRGGISRQQLDIGLCREARSNRHSAGEAPVASRRTSPLCQDARSSRHSTEEASVASSRTSPFAEKLGRAATRPRRHRSSTVGHRSLPRSSVEPPLDRGHISRQPPCTGLYLSVAIELHVTKGYQPSTSDLAHSNARLRRKRPASVLKPRIRLHSRQVDILN